MPETVPAVLRFLSIDDGMNLLFPTLRISPGELTRSRRVCPARRSSATAAGAGRRSTERPLDQGYTRSRIKARDHYHTHTHYTESRCTARCAAVCSQLIFFLPTTVKRNFQTSPTADRTREVLQTEGTTRAQKPLRRTEQRAVQQAGARQPAERRS